MFLRHGEAHRCCVCRSYVEPLRPLRVNMCERNNRLCNDVFFCFVVGMMIQVDLFSEIEDAFFEHLSSKLRFEPKWRALVCYLHQLGLGEEDFRKIVDRHRTCLQTNAIMVKERVEYLVSVGVERDNLSKLIVRHPQIIEYTVEKALKPRIQYLKRLGVPDSKLGRVISVAPSLLECSLNRSLKPRVEYLKDVVGIKESDIGLIITRSPQVSASFSTVKKKL